VEAARPAGGIGGELSSLQFAAVARQLGEAARRQGLDVPAFRSPPRSPGVRRALRRESDGSTTVSVALRGRPGLAVVADMIDGMVAAAHLADVEAGAVRDELWAAALSLFAAAAGAPGDGTATATAAA